MGMIAIGKNIVIQVIDEEIRMESGILLSADDSARMRYKRGLVVSPGTEVRGILEGDDIYYDKSHSFTMVIGSDQYTIINERDVVIVTNR